MMKKEKMKKEKLKKKKKRKRRRKRIRRKTTPTAIIVTRRTRRKRKREKKTEEEEEPEDTIRCWSMTSLDVTPCPLSWMVAHMNFMHSQFNSRRSSFHITTLVRMRSGSARTGIHDKGAEVTNGLQ